MSAARDVLRELSSRESQLVNASQRAFADLLDHYFRLVDLFDAARALLASVLDAPLHGPVIGKADSADTH